MPNGRDFIGGVGRDAWLTQYREGGNLQGAAEEKNAMPVLKSVDYSRFHDISLSKIYIE